MRSAPGHSKDLLTYLLQLLRSEVDSWQRPLMALHVYFGRLGFTSDVLAAL